MNTLKSIIVFMALALFALCSGCSILGDATDKAAKAAGKLVSGYCENVTIPEIREEIRAKVNAHAAPHAVMVQCANGGPALVAGGNQP